MRRPCTVLISGCGIAGPALAFWLERAGLQPTLVEAASEPRSNGYMIDFWGSGFDVAVRMGLGARLTDIGYNVQEMQLLDARGRLHIRLFIGTLAHILRGRYSSVLRGDLARLLFESVRDRVPISFGDQIRRLRPSATAVDVEFASGRAQTFDLVVGADGAHSHVRALAFGPSERFERSLDYRVAAFTASAYPHSRPVVYVSRTSVGRQVARFSLRDGRTVFFMFVAGKLAKGRLLSTPEAQKAFLSEVFQDERESESRDVIDALEACTDLYFDGVSQVWMPSWSRGRVALLGDAAFAPSLLAGEGASMAMVGAFILAGELANSPHEKAFASYEQKLRAFVERKQRAARRFGGWLAPRNALGLALRNAITRVAAIPPLTHWLLGTFLEDQLVLPEYEWPHTRHLRAVDSRNA